MCIRDSNDTSLTRCLSSVSGSPAIPFLNNFTVIINKNLLIFNITYKRNQFKSVLFIYSLLDFIYLTLSPPLFLALSLMLLFSCIHSLTLLIIVYFIFLILFSQNFPTFVTYLFVSNDCAVLWFNKVLCSLAHNMRSLPHTKFTLSFCYTFWYVTCLKYNYVT